MADKDESDAGPPPMNVYTAMLLLAFVAISVGCLMLALDLNRYGFEIKPTM
ncbi:MAG: hypothetical protein ISQ70_09510 [Pirellulales bacterium]|jgi:hypothetical protein|nr:hypothetical protein [Pirellulales bacterium]MBL7194492.1 hypothetical protein [Pirellulales bacterium]